MATGDSRGQAPSLAYSTTDRLVGLDARTGAQRWTWKLADDGQGIPAMIDGAVVVIAEADGTVLGLDAASGARRWHDRPPRGCAASSPDDGLFTAAAVLPGVPGATLLYRCTGGQRLTRLDPATGAVRWTLLIPDGHSIGYQSPAGTSRGMIGLIMSGRGSAIAPARHRVPPGPRGYLTESFLAVDAATGRPMWQVDRVPAEAGAFGGKGQLCLVSRYGTACYAARTGTESWQRRATVVPSQELGPDALGAAAVAGRLYLAVPTAAARSIPAGSTTYRSSPGAFRLQVTDMASGRLLAVRGLPAFYGGPDGVVASRDTPPGVVAVSDREVFVSPEWHETDVVEAFDRPDDPQSGVRVSGR